MLLTHNDNVIIKSERKNRSLLCHLKTKYQNKPATQQTNQRLLKIKAEYTRSALVLIEHCLLRHESVVSMLEIKRKHFKSKPMSKHYKMQYGQAHNLFPAINENSNRTLAIRKA